MFAFYIDGIIDYRYLIHIVQKENIYRHRMNCQMENRKQYVFKFWIMVMAGSNFRCNDGSNISDVRPISEVYTEMVVSYIKIVITSYLD
jgi:hypothetical protein